MTEELRKDEMCLYAREHECKGEQTGCSYVIPSVVVTSFLEKHEKNVCKKNNFYSIKSTIFDWAKNGVSKKDKDILYRHPLICGTITLQEQDYWLWVAFTKRGEQLSDSVFGGKK